MKAHHQKDISGENEKSPQLILVDRSKGVAEMDLEIALWKDSTRHPKRYYWNFWDRLGFH